MPDTAAETLAPVVRRTVVHCGIEHAWHVFTDEIGAWWPVGLGHAVGSADQVASVSIEPQLGGRVREHWHDGTEHVWAEVMAWEPPERLVLGWHPGSEGPATEVEVRFVEERGGFTRVVLEHRGWEVLGESASATRHAYEEGWLPVLNVFKGRADDPEIHRVFGISLNNLVWRELARTDRTADDDQRMVDAAHASLWHWAQVGTAVNLARGEWMCSHVYAVVGRPEPALHHANRALAVCEAEELGDFDLAYAYEAMARALALAGDLDGAATYRARAVDGVDDVADPIDREIFETDLAAGPWFGLEIPA
jgi:uncharacterized protein YndB with AHSA1/START domain